MSYSLPDRQLIRLDPALLDILDLDVPEDVAHWLAGALHVIQAVGDSSYIPAGTVVLRPELPPIPCTAHEIDQAIDAL